MARPRSELDERTRRRLERLAAAEEKARAGHERRLADLERAIVTAAHAGASSRAIAEAVGRSHSRVAAVVRRG